MNTKTVETKTDRRERTILSASFVGLWRKIAVSPDDACDEYEGHLKAWANCLNCGHEYREHAVQEVR